MIDVPEYVICLYIESTYTRGFNLDYILPEDFIKFLRLIDQYPTQILEIRLIEWQIVRYLIKYQDQIEINDLSDIVRKYELRYLYVAMHNKKYSYEQ